MNEEFYLANRLARPLPKEIAGRKFPASWVSILPGKASNFISPLNLTADDLVILCLRLSTREQEKGDNFYGQESRLWNAVSQARAIVIGECRYVGSGWYPENWSFAARWAIEAGALLLAESTDRFVRHHLYHSEKRWFVQATLPELGNLRQATFGARLMTLDHPDAPPRQIRSEQTLRGKKAKGNPGGRPRKVVSGYKKKERLEKLPMVRQLRVDGVSVPEICKRTGVARRTVYNWMAED